MLADQLRRQVQNHELDDAPPVRVKMSALRTSVVAVLVGAALGAGSGVYLKRAHRVSVERWRAGERLKIVDAPSVFDGLASQP